MINRGRRAQKVLRPGRDDTCDGGLALSKGNSNRVATGVIPS